MNKLRVVFITAVFVACDVAHSMQRSPNKRLQVVQTAAPKNNYPEVKTLPEAARRIQHHSTILDNLKHLPNKEFAKKKRYVSLLQKMQKMVEVAETSIECVGQEYPKEAEDIEKKCLYVFNEKTPVFFNMICVFGAQKKTSR